MSGVAAHCNKFLPRRRFRWELIETELLPLTASARNMPKHYLLSGQKTPGDHAEFSQSNKQRQNWMLPDAVGAKSLGNGSRAVARLEGCSGHLRIGSLCLKQSIDFRGY